MANETVYTRVYFPLPRDKDYYMVGFLANIVNKIHVHHFVVYFCAEDLPKLYREPSSKAGFPEQPASPADNGALPFCPCGTFMISGIFWQHTATAVCCASCPEGVCAV
jgi:hypothetical protein